MRRQPSPCRADGLFADEVFMQMHYGVGAHLAALCLVLLAMVDAGGGLVIMIDLFGRQASLVLRLTARLCNLR